MGGGGKGYGWYPPWAWKGWKGYGKGKGDGGSDKPPSSAVPADFVVDTEKVYTGTVTTFYKFNGYGFVELEEKGVVPNDKVFVYWKNIFSQDRFPSLNKDMKVQCTLSKGEKNGVHQISAVNVKNLDGTAIGVQNEFDAKKEFVGGQNLRYTGTCKFYIPKRGFGYIEIDDGFQYDKEGVPKEIRCEQSEMNAAGAQAGFIKMTPVDFGIWKTRKGAYKAYNVTLTGGAPLPDVEASPTPPPDELKDITDIADIAEAAHAQAEGAQDGV